MKTFTLTEDHIKLLRRSYVRWCDDEFGAPCIDPKRPYGNSDVCDDVAKIIGVEPKGGDPEEPEYTSKQIKELRHLHSTTETALQVVLASGSFEPGVYTCGLYEQNWRKA